jgi:phosphohistidine phosphatase
MQLTLVRHGEAHPAGMDGNDTIRPLTARGQQQAQQTADYLRAHIQPEVFVVSPLRRAQQTLAYLQQYYADVPVLVCDAIKPDDDPKVAIEWLAQLPYESIAVVCHMNVVAHIEALLLAESFHPFALAEARIYEQNVIAAGLSSRRQQFIPQLSF